MIRFTEADVQGMMSYDHLLNTAHALGKSCAEVSVDELIVHWKQFHANPRIEVLTFNVEEQPPAAEFCADSPD